MPVYDFTEIVDETIERTHPDPVACKIICKMLASNRVDVTVMKELEDSEKACDELYPEDLRPGLIADGTLGWAVVYRDRILGIPYSGTPYPKTLVLNIVLYLALTELKR
jgi:hypothetical protein